MNSQEVEEIQSITIKPLHLTVLMAHIINLTMLLLHYCNKLINNYIIISYNYENAIKTI